MAIKAGNVVVGNVQAGTDELKNVVFVETTSQENGTVIVDGKPKKFNKISRYMIDMLTTED